MVTVRRVQKDDERAVIVRVRQLVRREAIDQAAVEAVRRMLVGAPGPSGSRCPNRVALGPLVVSGGTSRFGRDCCGYDGCCAAHFAVHIYDEHGFSVAVASNVGSAIQRGETVYFSYRPSANEVTRAWYEPRLF